MMIYTLFAMQLGRPAVVGGVQSISALAGTNNLAPVGSTQQIPGGDSLSDYFLQEGDQPFIRRFRFDSIWKSAGAIIRWGATGNSCSLFVRNASRSPARIYDLFQPFSLGEWVDVNQLVGNPWALNALPLTKVMGFTATIVNPLFDSTKVPASFAGDEIGCYFQLEVAHTLPMVKP